MNTNHLGEDSFTMQFVVTDKHKPLFNRSSKGNIVRSQNLFLRAKNALDNEGNHKVVFRNDALSFLKKIETGDLVSLEFRIVANKSLTGTSHTNLLPLKIQKV
jgi:hypothetical protein